MIAAIAFMLLGEYINYKLPINLADIITPDFIRGVIERQSIGRTSYLQGIVPYTYLDLLRQTPLRILYFLFAPFPWLIRTVQDVIGFFDVVLCTVLFYYCYQGAKRLWSGKKHIVLSALMIAASLVVMFAWGTTNYGTAWRHRQKIAPFVIVIAAVGLAGSPRWKRLFPEEDGDSFDSYLRTENNYPVLKGDKL